MKKLLSIILSLIMLSSICVIGFAEDSTAVEAKGIKAFSSLSSSYDNFVYFGMEIYEIETSTGVLSGEIIDSSLTDCYVEPEQMLEVRLYVKSDMYCGLGSFFLTVDNNYFDVKQLTSTPGTGDNGYTSNASISVNQNHPTYSSHGLSANITSKPAIKYGWIKNTTNYTSATLMNWDIIEINLDYDNSLNYNNHALNFANDNYLLTFRMKVKAGVEAGNTGTIQTQYQLWKCGNPDLIGTEQGLTDLVHGRVLDHQGNLNILQSEETMDYSDKLSETKHMYANYSHLEHIFFDDLTHTFTTKEQSAETHSVKFNLHGHGTAIDDLTVSANEKINAPAAPEAVGYIFNGWYKEASCTTAWSFDSDTVSEDTILYAKWTECSHENSENTPDCDSGAVCSLCKKELSALGHNWSDTLTVGTDTHYYSCSRCTAITNEAPHSYNNYTSNGDGTHTGTCVCSKTHTEDCSGGTADCESKAVCDTCKSAYGNALGHSFKDWTDCKNGESHKRVCERSSCSATETSPHSWSDWKYNDDHGFFKDGTQTRLCSQCGALETVKAANTSALYRFTIGVHNFFIMLLSALLNIIFVDIS